MMDDAVDAAAAAAGDAVNDAAAAAQTEATANPLAGLGLGPMWQPTPSTWMWAKLNTAEGQELWVLRLFNAGGSLGLTMSQEDLARFVHDAQTQLGQARLAVPPKPQLIVPGGPPLPNRQQRRHPNGN